MNNNKIETSEILHFEKVYNIIILEILFYKRHAE